MSGTTTRCSKPGCTKVHAPKLSRAQVWKMLGEPAAQIGSVNDPRTTQEYGCTWNEKWTYCASGGRETERVVLWNRYDLQGVFRVKSDGSAEPESLRQH